MATYMLFAETPLTRQRESPNGPNIILSKDTKLGRAASGPGLLPVTWAQVSGVHCRIYLKDDIWYLEDSSTNGTAINGLKVPKGQSRLLAEGDTIRLAVATQDASKVIEYTFKRVPASPKARNGTVREVKVAAPPAQQDANKPKQSDSSSPPPAPTDTHVLQRLHKSNEDLRRRLDTEQSAKDEALKRVQKAEKELEEERRSVQAQLDACKAAVWAQADTSIREMMAKLAQTEKSLKSERLAHAEAKQDAAKLKSEADKALKLVESVSRERDLMAQQLRMTEERHSAMLHSAKDAEQRTEHEQQKLQAELQRAIKAKEAAERRSHEEAVARSTAEQRKEELQRAVWELQGKLQSAEESRAGAEERALCSASFLQHSLSGIALAQQQREAQQKTLAEVRARAASLAQLINRADDDGNAIVQSLDRAKAQLDLALGSSGGGTASGAAGISGANDLDRHQREPGASFATQTATQGAHQHSSGAGIADAAAAAVNEINSQGKRNLRSQSKRQDKSQKRSQDGSQNSLVTQPRSSSAAVSPTLSPDKGAAAAADMANHVGVRLNAAAEAAFGLPTQGASEAGGNTGGMQKPSVPSQGPSLALNNLIGAQPNTTATLALQQPSASAGAKIGTEDRGADKDGHAAADGQAMDEGEESSPKQGSESDERENTPMNRSQRVTRASLKMGINSQSAAASQKSAASQKDAGSEKQGSQQRGSWQLRKRRRPADTYEEDYAMMD